ncbi:MAG: HD-GYP domain-containing protein [Burkholderiaceae bacterium]
MFSNNNHKVAVENLKLGMYVVQLDRPWIGTSFPFQGFPLTSDDQIETLKSYCKTVFVDPDREEYVGEPRTAGRVVPAEAPARRDMPVKAELALAAEIHKTCENALKTLLNILRAEGEIDSCALTGAMSAMIKTVQRSPDAMLLLHALSERDTYELARAIDTSILMVTFAQHLGLPHDRVEALGLAGMLLDVGMTMLPQHVVDAFNSDAAVDDGLIETHVLHSVELIRSARGLPPGVDVIVSLHHERQDGEGYPHGLAGDQISTDGSIAAVVDAFSKLTVPRPKGSCLAPSSALNQLHKQRDCAFDPLVVDQFIQCIGIYPVGSVVELNSGEIGVVIAQNAQWRLLPRVAVICDANGGMLNPQLILNLARRPQIAGGKNYQIRRTLPRDRIKVDPNAFIAGYADSSAPSQGVAESASSPAHTGSVAC